LGQQGWFGACFVVPCPALVTKKVLIWRLYPKSQSKNVLVTKKAMNLACILMRSAVGGAPGGQRRLEPRHISHVRSFLPLPGFPLPVSIPKQLGLGFNKTCQAL
jgi:hypothetical protein